MYKFEHRVILGSAYEGPRHNGQACGQSPQSRFLQGSQGVGKNSVSLLASQGEGHLSTEVGRKPGTGAGLRELRSVTRLFLAGLSQVLPSIKSPVSLVVLQGARAVTTAQEWNVNLWNSTGCSRRLLVMVVILCIYKGIYVV
jgi:hypothetical protein